MDFHGIHLPDKKIIEKPGKKLSDGKNANVYEWGDEYVIKLFKNSYPIEEINREYYNALALKNQPFPKASVVELKKTEFGFGIVFRKESGETLYEYIERTGDLRGAAEQMAELQKRINSCTFDSEKTDAIESTHQLLRRNMLASGKADSDATKEMLRFLGTMKEGNSLCHGNLHPDNIILTKNGATAISFSSFSIGMPIYDVARTFFLIAYTPLPGDEPGCSCNVPGCRGLGNMEQRKELGRYYLNAMGKSAVEIGGYLSMIIAGM